MDLLLLFLVFGVIGYFLGVTHFGGNADHTTEKLAVNSKRWMDRLDDDFKTAFTRRSFALDFRAYVTGKAAELFPSEFRDWIEDLSERELQDFIHALVDYSHGLDFSLTELVNGGLDNDPRMRQVFIEAIVVYSPAYRKAKQARQKAEPADEQEIQPAEGGNGKLPAEKAPGRRSSKKSKESIEAASTD
jgi:hypothetical protein